MITRHKRAGEGPQRRANPPESDEGGQISTRGGEIISGGGELHKSGGEEPRRGGEELTLGAVQPSNVNLPSSPHSEVNSRIEEGIEAENEAERPNLLLDLILAASRVNSTGEDSVPTNTRKNPQNPLIQSENLQVVITADSVLSENGEQLGSDEFDSSRVIKEGSEGSSFPIVLNERPRSELSSKKVDTNLTSTRTEPEPKYLNQKELSNPELSRHNTEPSTTLRTKPSSQDPTSSDPTSLESLSVESTKSTEQGEQHADLLEHTDETEPTEEDNEDDYADVVDYGLEAEDYVVEGRKLAELAEDVYAEDEYYEYSYEDGVIRVPMNYSGLQFHGLDEVPRSWNARAAFLDQVAAKLYMFLPAGIGGLVLGIVIWLVTIFIIRGYGVVKRKILGNKEKEKEEKEKEREHINLNNFQTQRVVDSGGDLNSLQRVDHKLSLRNSFRPAGGGDSSRREPFIPAPDYGGSDTGHDNAGYEMTEVTSHIYDTVHHLDEDDLPDPGDVVLHRSLEDEGTEMEEDVVSSTTTSSSGLGNSVKGSLNSTETLGTTSDRNKHIAVQIRSTSSHTDLRGGEAKGADTRRHSD